MMDFVMIANAWAAGETNPTSKHRIALELARRGARVLWIEGSGMRMPSLGQRRDRGRLVRKVAAALRGAQRRGIDLRPETLDLRPETLDHRPETLDLRPETLDHRPKTLDHRPKTIDPRQETSALRPLTSALRPAGGIWTLSPLFVPLPRFAAARAFNGWLCAALAKRWSRKLGFNAPALINYVPVLAGALRRWPGRKVYHCVDRWDAFAMYDSRVMSAADEACCRATDVVIVSSLELEARCRRHNPRVVRVDHGVDHAHFALALAAGERPADLPAGPLVGFFGLLSEWLDQELLAALSRAIPEASIVLIGAADVPVERLRGLPNVHLPGPRAFRDLPRAIAHFQAGLIPFVVNELTRAVNPIKLREMLAAGCPVVSTDLPEVAKYADGRLPAGGIVAARTHAEFIDAVRACLAHPLPDERRRALSAAMAGETWERKVDEILAAIA